MKKRKNVLIIMGLLYIIAAVCAVVVFLTRPIGKIEHKQENGGHTGGNVQALAQAQTETKPQAETKSQAAEAASEQTLNETASKEPESEVRPADTESKPAEPEVKASQSAPHEQTQSAPQGQTQTAEEQTQPTAQVQPRTQTPTTAPDSPLLAGEYETLYNAVSIRGSVNMRKAPDNSGAVVFCIPQDGTCEVLLEDVEGWMLVRYKGYIGFVYESFLEAV